MSDHILSHYIDSLFNDVHEPKSVPTKQQEAVIKLKDFTPERKVKRVYRPYK